MKALAFLTAWLTTCCALAEDTYYLIDGIEFVVNEETLAKTSKIDPLKEPFPISAEAAMRIAEAYHKKTMPDGRDDWYVYDLSGAVLVSAAEGRWYWIVQYRGIFSPRPSIRSGGWITTHSLVHNLRYPVMMDGRLAPLRVRPVAMANLPKAIKPVPREQWHDVHPNKSNKNGETAGDLDDPFDF